MHQVQNNNVLEHDRYENTAILYRYVAEIDERLCPLGLSVEVDGDLNGWRDLISEKAPKFGVTRALDPHYNDLRPGNSYWIKILNDSGEPVACQADRICPTRHFVQEWPWTNRFYGGHGAPQSVAAHASADREFTRSFGNCVLRRWYLSGSKVSSNERIR